MDIIGEADCGDEKRAGTPSGQEKSGLRTERRPPEKQFRRAAIFPICGCCVVKNDLANHSKERN